MVSDGLKRSPLGHNFGTSGTDSAPNLSPVEQASLKTKPFGTPECHLFRKNIFEGHPKLALSMASSYLEIAKRNGHVEANQNLLALNDRLIVKDLNLSASIETLKQFATDKASYMTKLADSYGIDEQAAYQACCDYVSTYGFIPPKPSEHFGLISACINRMSCPRWWKKKLFTKQRRTIEAVDPVNPRIKGLDFPESRLITRLHNWTKYTGNNGNAAVSRERRDMEFCSYKLTYRKNNRTANQRIINMSVDDTIAHSHGLKENLGPLTKFMWDYIAVALAQENKPDE